MVKVIIRDGYVNWHKDYDDLTDLTVEEKDVIFEDLDKAIGVVCGDRAYDGKLHLPQIASASVDGQKDQKEKEETSTGENRTATIRRIVQKPVSDIVPKRQSRR